MQSFSSGEHATEQVDFVEGDPSSKEVPYDRYSEGLLLLREHFSTWCRFAAAFRASLIANSFIQVCWCRFFPVSCFFVLTWVLKVTW